MATDDSYTKSLLHMDGLDASTTFTDESGKVWTAYGNAQIDTAQAVFGGASGLFDGTGDYIETPDHADFDLGANDFTIDFRFRPNNVDAAQYLLGSSDGSTDRAYSVAYSSSNLFFDYSTNGTSATTLGRPATFAVGNWYHIAFVRSGNLMYMFQNGALLTTSQAITGTIFNSGQTFKAGTRAVGDSMFNGWIDEFRVSKGIARWTAAFNPPTVAYGTVSVRHITQRPRIRFSVK